MLVAYIDDSGLHREATTFCLAGYVADSADWFELSRAWRRTLDDSGVSSFHMSEFETRHGEFDGWSRDRRYALIRDLVSIVNATNVWGFGIGVNLADYHRVKAELISTLRLSPEWWDHPYLLAFQWCLVMLSSHIHRLESATTTIALTLDQNFHFQSRLSSVHSLYQIDSRRPVSQCIGSLSFGSRHVSPPLQVADIAAYEVRKFIDRGGLLSPAGPRISMRRLLRRFLTIESFTEPALRALGTAA